MSTYEDIYKHFYNSYYNALSSTTPYSSCLSNWYTGIVPKNADAICDHQFIIRTSMEEDELRQNLMSIKFTYAGRCLVIGTDFFVNKTGRCYSGGEFKNIYKIGTYTTSNTVPILSTNHNAQFELRYKDTNQIEILGEINTLIFYYSACIRRLLVTGSKIIFDGKVLASTGQMKATETEAETKNSENLIMFHGIEVDKNEIDAETLEEINKIKQ